jgi:hypothetical protein
VTLGEAREFVAAQIAAGVQQIDTRDLLLRFAAREAGFGGALRGPLTRGTAANPTDLASQVEALLPDTRVRALPHRNRFLRMVADFTSGFGGMTRLLVEPTDGRPSFRVGLPERDDHVAEVVALALDTAFGVHARFGRDAKFVNAISFDHAVHGMAEGKTAGAAHHGTRFIHINASYSFVQGLESMRTDSAQVPAPWTSIDGTVAHEMWHMIENAWEAKDYAATIEFRRVIGSWFGQPTLEKVFDVPEARYALGTSVSPYGASARLEASAEMFKRWWCGPAPVGSIPERFGALVELYFPAQDAGR